MKTKKLNKDIRKSITHSWGRFISIMFLMMLGSFALVGLVVTGPDMRQTGISYFKRLNTADVTVMCDYGIDKNEQEYIEKASGIQDVEYSYLKDVTIENTDESFRIFSKPSNVSLYDIKEGNLPQEDDEIAISDKYKDKYNIGDTITFDEKADDTGKTTLKNHKFKIVGFINSGEILSGLNLGQTTVGTGELNGYAIVNESVFDSNVYMMAKLTFKDTKNLDPYSNEYNNKIQAHKEELSNLLGQQQNIRLASIKSEYQSKIDSGQQELDKAKSELTDTKQQLANAKTQIDNGKQEISYNEAKLNSAKEKIDSSQTEINEKEKELNSKELEYNNGLKDYEQKQAELEQANIQINNSQSEIDTKRTTLEKGKAQYESGIASLNEAIANFKVILKNPNIPDEQKIAINKQLTGYEAQLTQTQTEYNIFTDKTYNPNNIALSDAQTTLDSKKEEYNSSKQQLDNANKELDSAKSQLDSGVAKLKVGKNTLSNAKTEYSANLKKLESAKSELQEKENEYNEKQNEFNEKEPDANQKIADSEKKLEDAKKKMNEISLPQYSVDNRRELPGGEGYKTYGTVSEIVDSLAKVFPVFLYFVAALVTLTTMTRFVGDERVNSGTLKSLGYNDKDVIKKFVIYGFVAGMLGTIIGIALGHTLFPRIVYNAYKTGFKIPKIELHFYPGITITAIILSLISSVIPAVIIAKKELQETAASLLQPKAPKAGTKIFLEKIKVIWNKMKFTQKVTARNIFRYKKRMFMTIFGVAGAVAILFSGFSVQYSISGINKRQFESIIKYDIIVALNNNASADDESKLQDLLKSDSIKSYSSVYYEEISKEAGKNNDRQDIKLIVPEDKESFNEYISLLNRKTGKKLELNDDGAIISERLANLLNIKVGDLFTFKDANNIDRTVKISGICEMYAGHFLFMNSKEYENVYNTQFNTNSKVLILNDHSEENAQVQAAKFIKLSNVKGVVQNTSIYNLINTVVKALNKIMLVLIVVAVLLAIVILYNLTNINVAERIRELCTIKVLGFYDNETTMYIYRETIILSALGIVFGWIIGMILHEYIITVVPPDEIMFNPVIWIGAYIIPFVTIAGVSFVLKYYVNSRLKHVDMLEALKSAD